MIVRIGIVNFPCQLIYVDVKVKMTLIATVTN
jgi:hypothetical protein